jgi:UDP-glucose 4-epimerase
MSKRVIIFGATGTVGAYAALHLKECGFEVIAVGHRASDNGFFADYGIQYASVDVTDKSHFARLPQQEVYGIVNLAGMLPARMKGYQPQVYIDTNITGMLNILEYAAKVGVSRFVYSQSISDVAYLCGSATPIPSDAASHFPLDNDHSVYSIAKNAAADLLRHYSCHYGFQHYILRFPNIYLYHPNPYYYVDGQLRMQGYRRLIYTALKGEEIQIWGDPGKVRDMVYVKDCTQIIGCCLSKEQAASGVYNVGTGVGTSLEDQVKGIVEVFSPANHPSPIVYMPDKPDAAEYIFDVSKTMKNLGYTPKYDYLSYLRDFKQEMEQQRFQKLWGKEQDYYNEL